MRFSIPTILLMVVCLAGCRQTTGLNSAGNLNPIGPMNPNGNNGTLTPLGTGQAAALGPFGGTTRVTPPPGSYVSPNNYMGGGQVAYPPTQPGFGTVTQNGFGAANGGGNQGNALGGGWNAPIGSGVQQTGGYGNPAGNSVPNNPVPNNPGVNPFAPNQGTFPSQPATPGSIRSGGMQAIDLTGAVPNQGSQLRSFPQSQQPNLNPAPGSQSFGPQSFGPQSFGPQSFGPQNNGAQPPAMQNNGSPTWRAPQVIVAPSQANIATAPTTDPIDSQNLQWRRPQ